MRHIQPLCRDSVRGRVRQYTPWKQRSPSPEKVGVHATLRKGDQSFRSRRPAYLEVEQLARSRRFEVSDVRADDIGIVHPVERAMMDTAHPKEYNSLRRNARFEAVCDRRGSNLLEIRSRIDMSFADETV